MKSDLYYMTMAYNLAKNSPDLSTQNGAILVGVNSKLPYKFIGGGVNRLPDGVKLTPERLERPQKYAFTEHAERNAIYEAARLGNSTEGSIMYALWAACDDCARAIIQAGVKKLVTHSFYRDYQKEDEADRKDWGDSISTAFQMLKEAGIEVEFTDMKIMREKKQDEFGGDLFGPLRFNGEEVMF